MKKSVAELGHNDSLKIYVDPSKIYIGSQTSHAAWPDYRDSEQ